MEETKEINKPHQELKAILDAIGEGITIVDRDLKITWVNSVIEKWAGPLDDIKGRYCYKVYQKKDIPCENCPTLKTLKTGKIEKARQHAYDSKGNIKYFEFTTSPLMNENGWTTGVVELAVDLTEKIQLEHKLKETKDRLQTIFDNIFDGISVIDKDYQILRVNRGILTMFDKKNFPELIGKKCFSEYYKSDSVCDNCPAKRSFEEGVSSHATKILQASGKGRMVLDISTYPIKDEEGSVTHVIEHIKNITNMVKLEDQLLYQERLAGVGELAAGIAHEIRNPLGNITASSQFCLAKYKLSETVRKHLKIILKNSENANRIIKDLLDFAKPKEISFEPCNVGEIIDSVCILVKTKCAKQRVRLLKRYRRGLPKMLLDKKRLEEAFLNFILNALEAMPEGGRLIITACLDSQNNEMTITFSDTGCGIAPENLSKIFDPFFSSKKEGVGLGLTLAQQVAHYHKGKLEVNSALGKGTDVIVKLPIFRGGGW